ncbi:MerR family transcriptional regulator [Shewanella surugensis]|uniref:MerR family transcriptional regulator n=1 Tax=Shewanella surugensis TaxID=212020 RepID=A0ABT0LJS1_9GAMM|nr:MerR family transcriptional regulator [Shewanella surugensis]MCL1127928.1 MerR family transcriptional regulator [Shewanella surugensis]
MKIGELAKLSGVAAHTIRFYETKGLLPKASRNVNGYRHYNNESVQRLATIQCAKRLGFSLEDILTVLAHSEPAKGLDHDKVLQQLDVRLLEVKQLIKALLVQQNEITLFKQQLQTTWQQGKCMQADALFDSNSAMITE